MSDDDRAPEPVQLRIVRQALDAAEEISPALDEGPPAEVSNGRDGPRHGVGPSLPDGCPVTPLGITAQKSFYLDSAGQLVGLTSRDHGRLQIAHMLGSQCHRVEEWWPRFGKPDKDGNYEITGWKSEKAAEALMAAAARCGTWNPFEKVRGAGAWRGVTGELVLHLGDVILVNGRAFPPGLIDGFVYPAADPLPRPAEGPVLAGDHGPAKWLLDLFGTWRWRRPELDPILLLGWIAAAMVGGALTWRPAVWITGGQGTGKSTLHEILKAVFGNSILSVSDTSAAGLWQHLGYDTLPVAIDELEADVDGRRADGVVKLARQASSGGVVLRGGQSHEGVEFVTRSCFLFSSIIIPALEPQDFSRIAILELESLPTGSMLTPDPVKLREIGAKLRRRLVDGWRLLPETLEIYRQALAENGHNARGCDQFGTLLALADLARHDGEASAEYARELAGRLHARDLLEWADELSDERGMLQFLLTAVVDPYRQGARNAIGDWILKAAGKGDTLDTDEANRVLGTYGLKVENVDGDDYLALANRHTGLGEIFDKTKWAAKPGRTGGWVQSARRVEGKIVPKKPRWFGGGTSRCTLIPLDEILPADASARLTVSGASLIEDPGAEDGGDDIEGDG